MSIPRSYVTVVGQAVGQLALVGVTPILTRIYQPADFGELQFSLVFAACLVPLLTLRLELVIPVLRMARYLRESMARSLRWGFVIIASLGGVAVSLYFTGHKGQAELILMSALIAGTLAWSLVDSALLVRDGELVRLGLRNGANGMSTALLQVVLGFVQAGPMSLAIALACGRALSVLVTYRFKNTSTPDLAYGLERYAPRQAAAGIATGVLLGASLQGPSALIGITNGGTAGGQAATAQRIAGSPTSLIGMAVGQVVSAHSAQLIQRNETQLGRYLVGVHVKLIAVSALVGGGVAAGALQFASFIFGAGWAEIGIVIALLTPMYALQFAVTPLTVVLPLLEKQPLLLKFEILRTGVILAGIALTHLIIGELYVTIAVWSALGTSLYLALCILTIRSAHGS